MKKITLLFAAAAACFLGFGLLSAAEVASETDGSTEKVAKPILIRHGFVYSAEISKKKPNFQVEVEGDQPHQIDDPVWAAVMLKLPKNRGISRFDYELMTPGGSYPCLAVALGAEPFSQAREHWTIEPKDELEGKFVRMLFAIPASHLTQEPLQNLQLVFKTSSSDSCYCQPPPIPFRLLPDEQPLSANPQTLGENGNCGLTWLEIHPEYQPPQKDGPSGEEVKNEAEKAEEKPAEKKAAAEGEKAEEKPAEKKAAAETAEKTEKKAAAEAEKAEEKPVENTGKKAAAETEEKAEKKPAEKAEKKAAAESEKSDEEPAEKTDKKASKKHSGKADKKAASEGKKSSEKHGRGGKASRGKSSKKKSE